MYAVWVYSMTVILIKFLVRRHTFLGKCKEEIAADIGKVRRGVTARQRR